MANNLISTYVFTSSWTQIKFGSHLLQKKKKKSGLKPRDPSVFPDPWARIWWLGSTDITFSSTYSTDSKHNWLTRMTGVFSILIDRFTFSSQRKLVPFEESDIVWWVWDGAQKCTIRKTFFAYFFNLLVDSKDQANQAPTVRPHFQNWTTKLLVSLT